MLYITDSDDLIRAATAAGTDVWKQEALKYRRLTAPAVLGNLVAVGDMEGYVHWMDRRDGRLVAQIKVADGPITGRPQVAGSKLYVYGNDGTLATLSAGSPPPPPPKPEPTPKPDAMDTPTAHPADVPDTKGSPPASPPKPEPAPSPGGRPEKLVENRTGFSGINPRGCAGG